jgi:hypothetical protein
MSQGSNCRSPSTTASDASYELYFHSSAEPRLFVFVSAWHFNVILSFS